MRFAFDIYLRDRCVPAVMRRFYLVQLLLSPTLVFTPMNSADKTDNMMPTAIVSGGSLGGLMTAIVLRDLGYRCVASVYTEHDGLTLR